PDALPISLLFILHGVSLLGAGAMLRGLALPGPVELLILLGCGLWPWLAIRGSAAATAPAEAHQDAQAFRSLSETLSHHTTQNALSAARVAFNVEQLDLKSTRLNSSHVKISYAVFCLKKKNQKNQTPH